MARGRGPRKCRRCGYYGCECAPMVARTGGGNGAYGTMGSQSMYYEERPNGSTDIFPDGMPRGSHEDFPHDHIVMDSSGDVTFARFGGEITMDDR